MFLEKILALFSIKKYEKQFISIAGFYAFCDGFVHEYIIVIPLSLFLARLDVSVLPYVYILAGVAFIITTPIYNYFGKHISIIKLSYLTLLFIAISIISFWFILNNLQHYYAPLVLLVWSWIMYSFMSLVLSNLYGSILTLQQAKRLYGPLDTVQGIGGIIGALSIPILVMKIGTLNCLLIIPLLLFIQIFIQFRLKKVYKDKLSIVQEPEETKINTAKALKLSNIFKREYVLFVLLVGIIISFEWYVLDMLFNTELRNRYQNEGKIAEFLGTFYAIINISSLFFSAFALRKLLEKIGPILSLFIMPIFTLLMVITAGLFNLIPPTMTFVFWAIAITKLFEATLNSSVNEHAIGILFQVLNPRERVWARTQHNTYSFSVAMGLSGVILLVLVHFFGVNIYAFGTALILFCLAHMVFLSLLKMGYIREIMNSLSKHFLIQPRFEKVDKESLSLLKDRLHSQFPDEVLYALNVLENAHFSEFKRELIDVLDHPSDLVKDLALTKLEQYRIREAKDKILALSKKQVNENVIIALAACGGDSAESLLETWLYAEDASIRAGAVLGLLKYGSPTIRLKAVDVLLELVKSKDPMQRQKSAFILGQVRKFPPLLVGLLHDESLEVRKVACEATAFSQEKFYIPYLLDNLFIPSVKNAAFLGLIEQDSGELLAFLRGSFAKYPIAIQEVILNALEKMKDTDGFILQILKTAKRRIFHASLQALYQKDALIEPHEANAFLQKEIQFLTELQNDMALIGTDKKYALLEPLLLRELELGLKRILMLLSLIYPRAILLSIEVGFAMRTEEALSYAIELLLNTLNKEHIEHVLPLLISVQNRVLGIESESSKRIDEIEGLRNILTPSRDYYISGIVPAAMYTACQHYTALNSMLKSLAKSESPDPLFQETSQYVVEKIGS